MRPAVDIVVPFVGSSEELESLCRHLDALDLTPGDTITVVDNRRPGDGRLIERGRLAIVSAPAVQSSYYARNCGARRGSSPWLLFIDADVRAPHDLLQRYFDDTPATTTGVLGGGIHNEPVRRGENQSLAARYSALSGLFDQSRTAVRAEFSYAMTANCAIRRRAFEDVGGFVEHVRSGGDADICFRLRAHGWGLEAREHAAATHLNRPTVRRLIRQSLRHGSGAAWLDSIYPGFSASGASGPADARSIRAGGVFGRALRSLRRLRHAGVALLRGDPEVALVVVLDIVRSIAFSVGRRLPNEVSGPGAAR